MNRKNKNMFETTTLPETNIAPDNRPSQKETRIFHPFSGASPDLRSGVADLHYNYHHLLKGGREMGCQDC